MDIKKSLGEEIERINMEIDKALQVDGDESLKDAMRHYPMAGGKRLRPALAMLVADAISGDGKKTLPFGVALEITHNFTLVHDDLMDRSPIRRGIKSVHTLWGEATAINAGDALFARAFEVLTDISDDYKAFKELLRDFSVMVRGIADGQQMDMNFEGRDDVTEAEYLKMIEKKTALMFQVAAKGGALLANGTREQIEAMEEYGRLLGMGFQIWDDYLDIAADQEKLGKPVGGDIRNGKRTLMVVYTMEHAGPEQKECFLAILGNKDASDEEVQEAIGIMRDVGAVEHGKQMALDFARRAEEKLECLPPSKQKDILTELVYYMIKRDM